MTLLVILTALMQSNQFKEWGSETLQMIRRDYYMPEQKLYGESIVPGAKPKQVSFNWGCGVMLSALVAGAKADPKFKPWLAEYADQTHTYWNPAGPIPGYDVLPMPKPVDRYYDDNAWMVMALCETYQLLGDKKYLIWAQEALAYVLSGEDSKLGGGIYWRESDKKSKNTCSNGPSAAACLAFYELIGDKKLLNKAAELYAWTKKNLQDPSDSLYWDNVNLEGKIEKTKWSYNTALMIRTAAHLYRETKNPQYREDTLGMVKSSKAKWLVGGLYKDIAQFAHLLIESWLIAGELIPESKVEFGELSEPLITLQKMRSSQGHYPGNWAATSPEKKQEIPLIDQASYTRACFVLAQQK
ncbi:MAG: glycoside hydrolase family 88 protein [Fimbriimonadaceae bacterium]|nr:MAG: glycoside hydrolase family 88 protein [Fimbriimonadaceae bacterium]